MSDQTQDKKSQVAKTAAVEDKGVGDGSRSLANWEKLASARRDLSGSDKARASLQSDPQAFLATYGINSAAFAGPGGQMGLTSLERQLAFSGGVERDTLGVHRGCELVVGPVAAAVAGVAAAAVAAVVAEAAAANAVWAANVSWTVNVTEGAG